MVAYSMVNQKREKSQGEMRWLIQEEQHHDVIGENESINKPLHRTPSSISVGSYSQDETTNETSDNETGFKDYETKLTWFVMKAAMIASLGGILFGYDLGVISSALPQVKAAFNLDETQQESVVSLLYLGAGFGALVGGYLCDANGRRWAILLTDLIFVTGAAVMYLAPTFHFLLVGRFIMGFGVSLSGCADVAYLTEIAPKYWRGALVSANEACISFGFLAAYTTGYVLSQVDPDAGWRLMFGLSSVMAIVQGVGMLTLPESPVWLSLQNGREAEVKSSLRQIYEFDCDVQVEQFYQNEFKYMMAAEGLQSHNHHSLPHGELSTKKDDDNAQKPALRDFYRQACIAAFLSIVQQFCGHANVLNFAPTIFASAGLGQHSALASTILLGSVKFIVTLFVIWKIDYVGRRVLLLTGMSVIAMSLLFMCIAFYDAHDVRTFLAVGGALFMAMGYAGSFGPLTWLLTSEMFPSEIRGRALGSSTVLSYFSASLVSFTFLSVQQRFDSLAAPFMMYLVITTISIIFAVVAIPDTGSQSPLDIHQNLQSMWFWRKVSSPDKTPNVNTNGSFEIPMLN